MDRSDTGRTDLFLQDLQTIVNIDSGSEDLVGVERVARFFEPRFQAVGLKTEIRKPGRRKVPCLVATNPPNAESFDIMFLGHMDTVFPKGESGRRPFSIRGDRAFGPGVCDMKGGLLVVLHALETLKKKGHLENLRFCVVFNGDEELGSESSSELIAETAKRSKQVFVFEPCRPGYRFVLWRKGGAWFFVTAYGKAAHAGADPEKGSNAVLEIAHQIIAIERLNRAQKGTTVNVTVVNGGNKVNVIPQEATAAVNVRLSTETERRRVETFFDSLPNTTHTEGVFLKVKKTIDLPPMEPNENTMALWRLLQAKAEAVGIQAKHVATGGCSDGNLTASLGIPTLDGMGTVGGNAHSIDEYIELQSVDPMIRIVSQMCLSIMKRNK